MNRYKQYTSGLKTGAPGMLVAFIFLIITLGLSSSGMAQTFLAGQTFLTQENCLFPAVGGATNGVIDPGETVTVQFAITNISGSATANLVATLQVGNGVISPTPGTRTIGALANGASATFDFQFIAIGSCGGSITPTLQLQDGGVNHGTLAFGPFQLGATVTTSTSSSTNTTAIIFPSNPGNGPASSYPSTVTVPTTAGNVSAVKVHLNGLSHTFPDDLNMLLVGPKGQKVFLMGDAGGSNALVNVNLIISDKKADGTTAADALPDETVITAGTYRPSDYDAAADADNFAEFIGGPAEPYSNTLSVFNGQDPAGTWQLFIFDDAIPDGGSLAGGWFLEIGTSAIVCCKGSNVPTLDPDFPDQTTTEDNSISLNYTITDTVTPVNNLVVTKSSSNQALVPDSSIIISRNLSALGVTIVPAQNAIGETTITITVTDADTLSSTDSFKLTVTQVNDNPTISALVNQSGQINVGTTPQSFTINDAETPADSLSLFASSSFTTLVPNNPANIVLTGSGNNRAVTIVPATNQVGSSTITLTVIDASGGIASSSFVVNIGIVAGAPTITFTPPIPAGFTNNEDVPIGPISFQISDATTPAKDLILTGSSSNPGLVPNGNILFTNNSDFDKTVTINPAANQFGSGTITISVRDTDNNTSSSSFTVTFLPVNDNPTISNIGDTNTVENTAAIIPFTVDDVEAGSSGVTVTVVSTNNPTLFPPANIGVSGTGFSRTLTVVPASNMSGVGSIKVVVSDGITNAFDEFVLTVSSINNPPTFTKGPDQTVLEDSGLKEVAGWATNVGPGPNEIGTVTFNLNATPINMFSTLAVIVDPGTPTVGKLSFTPATNANGTATVTISATDSGGATSAPQTFTINITPVNDAPTFTLPGTNPSVAEDSGPFTRPGFTVGVPLPGPSGLFNENSQALTFLIVSNSNPSLFLVQPAIAVGTGTLTFTPATNQNGVANLTVAFRDNGGTANGGVDISPAQTFPIFVNALADDPTITGLPASITTGKDRASAVTTFVVNDADLASNQQGGIEVTFSPAAGGPLIKDYQQGINGGNRALIIVPQPGAIGTNIVTVTINDHNATLVTPVGSVPDAIITRTFEFRVSEVNNPPTISAIANQSAVEDSALLSVPIVVDDIETTAPLSDAGLITVAATSSDQSIVANTNLFVVNLGSTNRTLIITPVANASGTVVITVSATDLAVPPGNTAALTNQTTLRSFTLTLTPVNDAPTISAIPRGSTFEDLPTSPIPFTVSDPESINNLTITASNTGTNKALVPDANIVISGSGANRTLVVTPAENQTGVTDITIRATDPEGLFSTSVFSLTVNPRNDKPVVTAIADQTIPQNGSLLITFDVSDEETASTNLIISVTSTNAGVIPSPITLDTNLAFQAGTRRFTLKPVANATGETEISIKVTDTGFTGPPVLAAETTDEKFKVVVGAVNQAPTITSIANITIPKNSSTPGLSFTINDLETPLGSLVLTPTAVSQPSDLIPANGIVFSGTGANRSVVITPALNKAGSSVITITVTDGNGLTASTSFTLTVTDVNTPPTISEIANQVTNEDTDTAVIPFTVGDAETPAGSLTLSATSLINPTNTALVPITVFFGGSGASRALFITPGLNQSGTNLVTVTVSDSVLTASRTFGLIVNAVNDKPTISTITNQTTGVGQAITGITFIVGDVETGSQFLNPTATSSNQGLIPNGSIFLGGTGTNRTLSIFPVAGQNGQSTITVSVTDANGASSSTTFVVTVGQGGPPAPTANDFNNDGLTDIVFENPDGFVGVWYMNNGPDLKSASTFVPDNVGDPRWHIVGTGDFNTDNKTDLLFQHEDGSLAVWFMDGKTLLSSALLNPSFPGDGWHAVGTGDINKDGKEDIVFQHNDGTLAAWYMDGVNLVAGHPINPAHAGEDGWRVAGTADFNQTGSVDLVFQNINGNLAAWYMNGLDLVQGLPLNPDNPGDLGWNVAGTVDLNKDGKTDLLFQHDDGSVAVWLMNGINLVTPTYLNPPTSGGSGWHIVGPR